MPLCSSGAGRRSPSTRSGRGQLANEDGVADLDLVEQLDHVRDRHPDAAVRGRAAERADVRGAVDAGAPAMPIQRALIGSCGPGGITLPASAPAHGLFGTCHEGFTCLSWIAYRPAGVSSPWRPTAIR